MDQSAARALSLLEALARAGGPVRLSHLAAQTGGQKSTTHRLLQSLIELGYVEQEAETGRYGPTLKLWELGSSVVVEHPVKRAASSFLQALHKETGESVSLLVRSGDDVLYLEKLFSPRPVRFSTRPGSRVPAPLTAGGMAMLSHDPQAREVVERMAARLHGRREFDVERFMSEIEATRQRGYSISAANAGVVSFGCALPARAGRAVAALSVSAPSERLQNGADAKLVEALLSTCARLVQSVGLL
ncbi:IclR family transcriptional regulator [soil metagenome]